MPFFRASLNSCIIIHGISISAWTMSFSKFIHININESIYELLQKKKQTMPRVLYSWDDWRGDEKGLANLTRNIVVGLWIFLVLGTSIYSLTLVDLKTFANEHPVALIVSVSLLLIMKLFVFYSAISHLHFIVNYHLKTSSIKTPTSIIVLLSVLGTILLFFISLTTVMYG